MQKQMSTEKAKEKAKERDDYRCRFCGIKKEQHKDEYGRDLHAHHIIKDNDGGADHPRNFITVCRDCHTTLEQTQADALSRIKSKHTQQVKEQFKERINALEADLRKERNSSSGVYAWLEQSSTKVHILLDGLIRPDLKTYNDREEAADAYAESEGTAKLVTVTASFGEEIVNEFRFVSGDNIEINYNSSGGNYFDNGQMMKDGYRKRDVPKELRQ